MDIDTWSGPVGEPARESYKYVATQMHTEWFGFVSSVVYQIDIQEADLARTDGQTDRQTSHNSVTRMSAFMN